MPANNTNPISGPDGLIPSNLRDRLQLADITDTNLTITGEEARRLHHLVNRVSLYAATKGLPEDLVKLFKEPKSRDR